ncbi:hypothetical protein T440DRAFT_208688 [Plenodomus tracheiphilus IPT5]|uniref:Uncharacterized protein n=1 Tax=Plenodomus tracheiphilus IPT5 TaxID=1408161 RepID=A0A6A7BJ27_9PLEO|nr:hypothetical protein T440DRAFT_208688 [Plenodomus tracheiphilus IPT5]
MRRRQFDQSFSASTLITHTTPRHGQAGKDKSISEKSTSTAGMGRTPWARMAQLVSPTRRTHSTMCSTDYHTALTSVECAARSSLIWLPEVYLSPRLFLCACLRRDCSTTKKGIHANS